MKIMHTMASEAIAGRPKRRFYSPELKTQVVAECQAQGASVAGVALLKRGFSDETVGVGGLLLSALGPTAVAAGAFLFL